MQSTYVAKFAFTGNTAASQLSFAPGAIITAKDGQDSGGWWWGRCNGKDGWFPPAYVVKQEISTVNRQVHVQEQPRQVMTSPKSSALDDDPFAGLDNAPLGMNTQLSTQRQSQDNSISSPSSDRQLHSTVRSQSAAIPMVSHVNVPQTGQQQQVHNKQQDKVSSAFDAMPSSVSPGISRSAEKSTRTSDQASVSSVTSKKSDSSSKTTSLNRASTAIDDDGAVEVTLDSSQSSSVNNKSNKSQGNSGVSWKEQELQRQLDLQKEKERKLQEELEREKKRNAGDSVTVATNATSAAMSSALHQGYRSVIKGYNAFSLLVGAGGSTPVQNLGPIYRSPGFWSLMKLDTYVRRLPIEHNDVSGHYNALKTALTFYSYVAQQSSNSLDSLGSNQGTLEAGIRLIQMLPFASDPQETNGHFINFINALVNLIGHLPVNEQIILPGGWKNPEQHHIMLYILRNVGEGKFTFTVCNTGLEGLEYHASRFDETSGRHLKNLALTVWDIPAARILDSSFWTVLFYMQIYSSRKHNAELLYTKLLSALNSRPLRSNLEMGPADYFLPPSPTVSASYFDLALIAFSTTPQIGAQSSQLSMLLIMKATVEIAFREIANAPPSSMDPEDTRVLRLAGRNLANFASTIGKEAVKDSGLLLSLQSVWDMLSKFLTKLNLAASKPLDQHTHIQSNVGGADESEKPIPLLKTDPGAASHQMFGRLRRDNFDNIQKALMGDALPDPILIPVVLTDDTLPPVATDYQTAASSLLRMCNACSLLMQQRKQIKNAPALAASAAQFALTVLLPMPNSDPVRCFWRKFPMRRETQVYILFLIRRMCSTYNAATACIQQSRGLIATRSTTFACATCVADAISRVSACDDPSPFSLHYSGDCEGPTLPFGIEAGSYNSLGANLPIYEASFCALRSICLDYLRDGTCFKYFLVFVLLT